MSLDLDPGPSAGHRPERKLTSSRRGKFVNFCQAPQISSEFHHFALEFIEEINCIDVPMRYCRYAIAANDHANTNLGFIDIRLEWMRVQADRE
ncbi:MULTISPECIES: hypothetical protein [unclassified Bradyrhizobium]|uniref:hypothetical protein n=1 Tax=unclassified Bradyrhizobium TaxID=2631580 RepID=UPI001CD7F1EA|nr:MULTISPECIES: hypothetical protein [unclassified Bradyrhizobium]MCA1385526.1 hypothetical protein [Bradyrhizobium sp. BRP05]MCA1393690.1 hypothetical protein [Bradyrhizobium sp. IC3123]MCA1422753.1 hypothetical protein [Bradyrhizobium sp. BRP23]MCA1429190.1 hypothetical protein [Bradyrhizobium sp. NBAIM16]